MKYLISHVYEGDDIVSRVHAFESLAACDRYFELTPSNFRGQQIKWARAVGDVGVRPPYTKFTEAEIDAAEDDPITLAELEAWQAIEELTAAHIEYTQDAIFDIVFGDESNAKAARVENYILLDGRERGWETITRAEAVAIVGEDGFRAMTDETRKGETT